MVVFFVVNVQEIRYSINGSNPLSLSLPINTANISSRLEDGIYSKLDEKLIQRVTSPFDGLNRPSRLGDPNAIRRHTSPHRPPQCTILQTERSTGRPLFSSFTPLQKVFRKKLSTAHVIDVLFQILPCSSQWYVVSGAL
jgi:hypothetical protein